MLSRQRYLENKGRKIIKEVQIFLPTNSNIVEDQKYDIRECFGIKFEVPEAAHSMLAPNSALWFWNLNFCSLTHG